MTLSFYATTRPSDSPDKRLITTAALPQLAMKWISYLQSFDQDFRSRRYQEIFAVLTLANRMVAYLGSLLSRELCLSLQLLFEFLETVSYKSVAKLDTRSKYTDSAGLPGSLYRTHVWEPVEDGFLTTLLKDDGWCPSEIAMLKGTFSRHALYFIYNLQRPNAHVGHALCDDGLCHALQIDTDSYKTTHLFDGCRCGKIVADPQELSDILEAGTYPLISVSASSILSLNVLDNEEAVIKLVKADANTSYVAISHVWSDGFGNPRENALPLCVMKYLTMLVSAYLGSSERGASADPAATPSPFWIDTLCCPFERGHPRSLALSRMRQTYHAAEAVLVIDNWLRKESSMIFSPVEKALRLYCSPWFRRLWTFEEGLLAKRLLLWVDGRGGEEEGFIDIDANFKEVYLTDDNGEALILRDEISIIWNQMRGIGHLPTSKSLYKFPPLLPALRFRSTSKPSDEAICLGAILNLDLYSIVQTEPERRMEKFWGLLSAIPAQLLLWEGPRLAKEGFRWAPDSILNSKDNKYRDLGFFMKALQVTARGLIIEGPSFQVLFNKQWPCKRFYFYEVATGYWRIADAASKVVTPESLLPYRPEFGHLQEDGTSQVHQEASSSTLGNLSKTTDASSPMFNEGERQRGDYQGEAIERENLTSLILIEEPEFDFNPDLPIKYAFLIRYTRTEGDTHYGEYLARCSVMEFGVGPIHKPERLSEVERIRNKLGRQHCDGLLSMTRGDLKGNVPFTKAMKFASLSQWCVG
jgi:hypothetical protein